MFSVKPNSLAHGCSKLERATRSLWGFRVSFRASISSAGARTVADATVTDNRVYNVILREKYLQAKNVARRERAVELHQRNSASGKRSSRSRS